MTPAQAAHLAEHLRRPNADAADFVDSCNDILYALDLVASQSAEILALQGDLHAAIVREREAESRAAAAEFLVFHVSDRPGGYDGEINVFSDGHAHYFVPTSTAVALEADVTRLTARVAELEAELSTTKARLDGTTSAIPTIAANHATAHAKPLRDRISALEDTIDLEHALFEAHHREAGPEYEAALETLATIEFRRGVGWKGARE